MPQAGLIPTVSTERVFLSTEWRDLLMLNFEVDPALVQSYVPRGTELDSFQGKIYASLVGLRFANTKILGKIAVPFHTDFDEVNLRIYVRRNVAGELRRGVVFIREIVPLPAVSFIARAAYGENYISCPMSHSIATNAAGGSVEYGWKSSRERFHIRGQTEGHSSLAIDGSLEQFISEHYWGYAQRRGRSLEYHVTHDPWKVWSAREATFEGDGDALYGAGFGRALSRTPDSAFIAEGSPVVVFVGRNIL